MGHAFCLPVLIAVTLLVSFNPFVGGAGLFPWGLQHGDIAAWDSDDSGARETIDLVRPVQFNGVMYDQITVCIHKILWPAACEKQSSRFLTRSDTNRHGAATEDG